VREQAKVKTAKLSLTSDAHVGVEILHLFIMDILGRKTSAAKIFETKADEDFKHTSVVTFRMKAFAATALLLANIFFIYFAMIKGYIRGLTWQRAYLTGCIIQVFAEIVFFETFECLWMNFLIPDLVSKEVKEASAALTNTIDKMCSMAAPDDRHFLNAPAYLFLSTNVAMKFPSILESMIVKLYSNHMPGQLSKNWTDRNFVAIYKRNIVARFAFFNTIWSLVLGFGTLPVVIQRVFIRLSGPMIFDGASTAAYALYETPAYFSIFVVAFAAVVARVLYLNYLAQKKERELEESSIVSPLPSKEPAAVPGTGRKVTTRAPHKMTLSGGLAHSDSDDSSSAQGDYDVSVRGTEEVM
jgi:hypothetical protein